MAESSHGKDPEFDSTTNPPSDGSNLSGIQLVLLMGGTLLAALIFLDIVSG